MFDVLIIYFICSLNRSCNTYFNTAFLAYVLGLVATIVIMSVFKHAQPALLYLVPACIGLPLLVALVKGDIKAMFSYEDHPAKEDETKVDSSVAKVPLETASRVKSPKAAESKKAK